MDNRRGNAGRANHIMRRRWLVRRHFAVFHPTHIFHVVFCGMASSAVHDAAHPKRCAEEGDKEEYGKEEIVALHRRQVSAIAYRFKQIKILGKYR